MKNILKLTIPCLLIFILSYGVSNAQETTLFAAVAEVCGSTSVNSSLYTINPVTAQAQEVGPTGFNGVTALAFLGDGRLVASANADDNGDRISILIEINPLTGQGTLIGTIGNNSIAGQCGRVPGLTYDHATDTLYGMGNRCPDSRSLLEINKTTGQGTIIGPGTGTGLFGSGNGLAIRDDGVMFWTPDEDLITINPNTGQVIQVKTLSVTSPTPLINGLAFHPVTGVLFGSNINPPEPLDLPQHCSSNCEHYNRVVNYNRTVA